MGESNAKINVVEKVNLILLKLNATCGGSPFPIEYAALVRVVCVYAGIVSVRRITSRAINLFMPGGQVRVSKQRMER